MFTGLIEGLGTIEAVKKGPGMARIRIGSALFTGQKVGDSICVNGACLTISDINNTSAVFDVMEETLGRADLESLKSGDNVNLERALKVGDRLGGHFVTGHIDCTARILEKNEQAGNNSLKVSLEKDNLKYVVEKGSVTLDGISLTIAEVGLNSLTVYLVPHTLRNTNLAFKKIGDNVNVEFDILGKYAMNLKNTDGAGSKITEEFLRGKGFF